MKKRERGGAQVRLGAPRHGAHADTERPPCSLPLFLGSTSRQHAGFEQARARARARAREAEAGVAAPSVSDKVTQHRECHAKVEHLLSIVNLAVFLAALCAPFVDGGLALGAVEAEKTMMQLLYFLALKAVYKDFNATAFSCSKHLDAAWHLLMLHPVLYRAVCDALCGAGILIDHNPAAGAAALATQRAQRLAHTLAAYEREFCAASPDMWRDDYQQPLSGGNDDGGQQCFYVSTLTGKRVALRLVSSDTVYDVKLKVQKADGTLPDQQRLIFAGKQLEDGRTLAHYHIQKDCVVYMVLTLSGC